MRVLYIMPAEGFGGAERQGVVHIANLPKAGVEVVAAVGPGQAIRTELDRAGVTGYVWCPYFPGLAVEARGLLASIMRPWLYFRSWLRSVRSLVALGRKEKVDMVLASRTYGWIVGSIVARRLGVPAVWRVGSLPSSAGQWFTLRNMAKLIAPSALVANSEMGRRLFSRYIRAPSAVLPNGVDTRRFNPERTSARLRRELGLEQVPVIGLAARPAPEKGLFYLAEVARIILSSQPTARFLIAGEFSWRQFYERQFADMGLASSVTFLGHVADVESFYASCDVIILTSRKSSIESSSNAVMEAMSTGRPVVVTDVGAMSELVREGVSGFLVSPDRPAELAGRVIALLASPRLRSRIGAAAREHALARHSQESVAATLASVLLAVKDLAWSAQATVRVEETGKEVT